MSDPSVLQLEINNVEDMTVANKEFEIEVSDKVLRLHLGVKPSEAPESNVGHFEIPDAHDGDASFKFDRSYLGCIDKGTWGT